MSEKLLLLICLVAFVQNCNGGTPSFIKKCKREDNKCLKESAQAAVKAFTAGIPELGVEILDPLHYDMLDASGDTLKLILKDFVITGMSGDVIKKIQRINSKLVVKTLSSVKLEGQYEMGGQFLLLAMEGKGKMRTAINDIVMTVEADIVDKVGKDGKVHWDITTWKHSYEMKGNAEIEMENLFEGNEVLAQAAKDLLKSSSNEIVAEVSPPIIKSLLARVIKNIDRFFRAVPVEDLELD